MHADCKWETGRLVHREVHAREAIANGRGKAGGRNVIFSSFGADRRSGDPSRGSLSTNHDNTTYYFVILVHLVIAIIEYGLW